MSIRNPYANFKTDRNAEVSGVVIDYGDFKVRLARAGGSNEEYNLAFDRKARAMRRTGTPSAKRMEQISIELLAETCVKGWQVRDAEGNWVDGIYMPNTGKIEPFNVANVKALFEQLPDLARALFGEASSLEVFNAQALEEEAGN